MLANKPLLDDLGVVSSALPSLAQSFNLSNKQQENVVGVLYLGSATGSAFGGFLCDYLGRKSGILFTDVVFIVGSLVLAFASSVPTVIIGKELCHNMMLKNALVSFSCKFSNSAVSVYL